MIRFLTAKRRLVDNGEPSARHWADCHQACGLVVKCIDRNRLVVDLAADDFSELRAFLAKGRGLVALRNQIDRVYTLHHVFLTIGEESRDQVAVAHVMGHVVPGMGTAYREKVSDERLRAVCEHVRVWLFGKAEKPKPR